MREAMRCVGGYSSARVCGGVDVRLQQVTRSQGIGACARSNDIEATDVDYNRAQLKA